MTAIFTTDDRYADRLERSIAGPTALARSWDAFCRAAADAACGVVLIPDLAGDPVFDQLRRYKARFPHQPVILVTEQVADNVRRINDVLLEAVLWTCEIEHRLDAAVRQASSQRTLRLIADAFEKAEHLPLRLRTGLAAACREPRPIRSVQQLAAACGCDRRTVWHQWKGVPYSDVLPLKDVLRWILLVRAVALKVPGRGWSAVAEQLGTDARNLGRWSARLTGRSLRELNAGGMPLLLPPLRQGARLILQSDVLDNLA